MPRGGYPPRAGTPRIWPPFVLSLALFLTPNLFKIITRMKHPQYCWEFHDNSSERPSPEPLLKKEASPAVLGGGGENSGNALEASNALNYRVWAIPAVLSRGIPGSALRAFPGFFRNFLRKVPAVLGVWPNYTREITILELFRGFQLQLSGVVRIN